MPISRRDGGIWKTVTDVYRRDGGVWKPATHVYRRDAGIWKLAHEPSGGGPLVDIDGVRFDGATVQMGTFTMPATSPVDRTKATISFRFEREGAGGGFGQGQFLTGHDVTDGDGVIRILPGGEIANDFAMDGIDPEMITSSVFFPNPSAVVHVLIVYDSTQAVQADRLRMWVDGTEVTSYSQDERNVISLNEGHDLFEGSKDRWFGTFNTLGAVVGVLGDFIMLDGIAETDPTAFDGVYSGPYGARGIHLDFANSADLGNDISGNGNHFTITGLDASDHVNNWTQI